LGTVLFFNFAKALLEYQVWLSHRKIGIGKIQLGAAAPVRFARQRKS